MTPTEIVKQRILQDEGLYQEVRKIAVKTDKQEFTQILRQIFNGYEYRGYPWFEQALLSYALASVDWDKLASFFQG